MNDRNYVVSAAMRAVLAAAVGAGSAEPA